MNPQDLKSDFDDDSQQIMEAIKDTASKAIAESKALGLTITYTQGDKIIEESPDGSKRVVGIADKEVKYQKGQKLYGKRKS